MKGLIFIFSLSMVITAFAGETQTECPMMKELTVRNNPKAQLENNKIKESNKSKVTAQ
jgi:hypothetical protein